MLRVYIYLSHISSTMSSRIVGMHLPPSASEWGTNKQGRNTASVENKKASGRSGRRTPSFGSASMRQMPCWPRRNKKYREWPEPKILTETKKHKTNLFYQKSVRGVRRTLSVSSQLAQRADSSTFLFWKKETKKPRIKLKSFNRL